MRDAVYSNYLQEEGDERARAAYGGNYPRLVTLKREYAQGRRDCLRVEEA